VSKVVSNISISLDGFVAGPDDSPENPLGDGGEGLHEWIFDLASWRRAHGRGGGKTGRDDDLMAEAIEQTGATVMGRRMFDQGERPWGDEPPFRHDVFVLTHRPREPLRKQGGTTFFFVEGSAEEVLTRAREASGEKDVSVASGQAIVQFLEAGLLDELTIHLVPVFFGGGVPLFASIDPRTPPLELVEAIPSEGVTHLRFRRAN
jgi:dihydrofolate reductase